MVVCGRELVWRKHGGLTGRSWRGRFPRSLFWFVWPPLDVGYETFIWCPANVPHGDAKMTKMSRETKTAFGMLIGIVAMAWVVYALLFISPMLPVISWTGFWAVPLISGITLFFFWLSLKEYRVECYGRLKRLCAIYLALPWIVFFLYYSGIEVFRTVIFTWILVFSLIPYFGFGAACDFFDNYVRLNQKDVFNVYSITWLVATCEGFGFYAAYFYDGPYCDSWGFAVAAAITIVVTSILILIHSNEKYDWGVW